MLSVLLRRTITVPKKRAIPTLPYNYSKRTAMNWHAKDVAAKYKPGEGMTGPFALHLIRQSGLDRADGSTDLAILDNACGTGIATVHLYDTLPDVAKDRLEVVCGDWSEAMVKSVQERIEQNGWKGATAKVVDAQNMDLPAGHFSHVITNFALVGVPNPRALLSETARVLRRGGLAAITVWKSVGWYEPTTAALALIPGAPALPSLEKFSSLFLKTKESEDECWVDPAFFEARIREAGFGEINTVLQKNVTRHGNAEHYAKVFAPMSFTMLNNLPWSEEEKGLVKANLEQALVKVAQDKFGEGEVSLEWEAWCMTAKKL